METIPFDAAEYFDSAESQAELLADAVQTGERVYIAHALNIVARARRIKAVVETHSADARPRR